MDKIIYFLETKLKSNYPHLFKQLKENVGSTYDRISANLARQLKCDDVSDKFYLFLADLDSLIKLSYGKMELQNPNYLLAACRKSGICEHCREGREYCLLGEPIEDLEIELVRIDTITGMHYKLFPSNPIGGFDDPAPRVKRELLSKPDFEIRGFSSPYLFAAKKADLDEIINNEDSTEIVKQLGLHFLVDTTQELVVTFYPTNHPVKRIAKPTIIEGWGYAPFRVEDTCASSWGKAVNLETGHSAGSEAVHCPIHASSNFQYKIWNVPGPIEYDQSAIDSITKDI